MSRAKYVPCTRAAREHIASCDERMRAFIAEVGPIRREAEHDLFSALISSIVSQQISTKAADTIWSRIEGAVGRVTPAAMRALSDEEIASFGTSRRKASYIKAAAERSRELRGLSRMDDAAAIDAMCALPGVGVWTAEMMLIFALRRPDVLSWGDLGIRRGMAVLYGLGGASDVERGFFEDRRAAFAPHNTTASLYFWEAAHRADREGVR